MPPARRSTRTATDPRANAFGRAHPNLQRALLFSCDASPALLIATILAGAGLWKRPFWQRSMLWRVAMWSFMSRWILLVCAVTWTWNEWGRERETGEPQAQAQAERNEEGGERGE